MATRVVTVNGILDERVGLDLECLDRIHLNGWVPSLQVPGQRRDGQLLDPAGCRCVRFFSPAILKRIGLRCRGR